MNKLNNIRTIFFDYDGTLHNSIEIYAPAFRKAYKSLVKDGLAEDKEWADSEIAYWLGFSSKDMWSKFLPDLDEKMTDKYNHIVRDEMKRSMENNEAELFEGVLATLEYLKKKGYKLVFISNCSNEYKQTAARTFNLNQYFDKMVSAGEYDYLPKYKILQKIRTDFPNNQVIVGDRFHDIEAGKLNNIYTIGCEYGYHQQGELDEADVKIKNIRELQNYL